MLHSKFALRFILVLMSLMLCGYSKIDHENLSQDKIKNKFIFLQKYYFEKLDFRVSEQKRKTIPVFSVELSTLADEQRARLAETVKMSQQEREDAGLIFIYDALMIANNTIGVREGKLSFSDLIKARRFAKTGVSEKEELIARIQYCISEFAMAAHLRPEDRRIDGWIIGTEAQLDEIKTGKISKSTYTKMMSAISARPSFNLWTAILTFHQSDAASLGSLEKAARNFVDAANQGKDPCTLHPRDCQNNAIAPFNFQASVIELGDVFLRRAEYFLQKSDIQNAMTMAEYANGTYASLNSPLHISSTEKWPDRETITLRKTRLNHIQNKQLPKKSLIAMEQYQRAYECSACHGRVK